LAGILPVALRGGVLAVRPFDGQDGLTPAHAGAFFRESGATIAVFVNFPGWMSDILDRTSIGARFVRDHEPAGVETPLPARRPRLEVELESFAAVKGS
jgi:hypothetical protein